MSRASALNRLHTAICELSGAQSHIQKKSLMIEHFDEQMKTFWRYGLDPFKTYGVKDVTIPGSALESNLADDGAIVRLLEGLSSRQLSGIRARDAIHEIMLKLSEPAQIVLSRILMKDFRVGIGVNFTNKVFEGLVPDFAIMLAAKLNKKKLAYPIICQPKLDGVRVLVVVDPVNGTVDFLSRSGKPLPALAHLEQEALSLAMVFHTHLGWDVVAMDGEAITGDFAKTVSEARRKRAKATDARIYLFDAISGADLSKRSNQVTCKERINIVQSIVAAYRADHAQSAFHALSNIVANNEAQVMDYYDTCRAKGLEGVIVKDPAAYYQFRRNTAWMKLKNEESEDLFIVDAIEGEGKYAGMLGALVVDYKGVRVNVGTGYSDLDRFDLWKMHKDCLLVGRLIEVEFMEVTPDGSLRHPRYKGFRDTDDRPGDKL